MALYQIFYDICNNLRTKNKTERTMKNKNEFEHNYQKAYDPFKVTIEDVRKVNDMMIKGLGIPENEMRFKVHLTEEKINSAYGKAIQEIQKY